MPIDKRLKRELKKNFTKYFFIALILFLGIMIISAFFSSTDGITDNIASQRELCCVEDANVSLIRELDSENKEKLYRLGVEKLEDTSYADLNAFAQEDYEMRIFSVRTEINKLSVVDGKLPVEENEIALEEKTAAAKELSVGDSVEIDGKKYILSGIVTAVDYNNVLKTVTSGVANFDVFGIGFVSKTAFEELADKNKNIQYSFTVNNEETIRDITDYLRDENLMMSVLKRTDNPRIQSIDEKAETMKAEITLIGIVFIFLVAFIFYVMSSASIEKDSTLIGTLFSMGYTRGEIVRHYLKLPLIITIIASVTGMFAGMLGLTEVIGMTTYGNYSLPSFSGRINTYLIILCCVFPFVIQLLTNGILLGRKLNIMPVQLMRNKGMTGKGFRKVKLDKKSFSKKMYIRIMLRGLKNQMVLFLGVLIAMFFLVMGFGMKDTLEEYVADVENNGFYKYCYILNAKAEPENEVAYKEVTVGGFQVTYSGINMKLTVYGLEENHGVEGITKNENEIVISDSLASKLSLKEGDILDFYSEELEENFAYKVVNIIHDPVGLNAYMDRTLLNEILEYDDSEEYYNALLAEEELELPEGYVAETVTHNSQKLAAEEMQEMMTSMIMLLIVMAVVIFAAVMYILLKMIIEKSAYSISLMKIFGYTDRENNHFYLNSFFITIVISLLVSLPVDMALFTLVWPMLNANLVGFVPVVMYPVTYVIIIVFCIVVYFAVTLLLRAKLKRIPMNMILKQRD